MPNEQGRDDVRTRKETITTHIVPLNSDLAHPGNVHALVRTLADIRIPFGARRLPSGWVRTVFCEGWRVLRSIWIHHMQVFVLLVRTVPKLVYLYL